MLGIRGFIKFSVYALRPLPKNIHLNYERSFHTQLLNKKISRIHNVDLIRKSFLKKTSCIQIRFLSSYENLRKNEVFNKGEFVIGDDSKVDSISFPTNAEIPEADINYIPLPPVPHEITPEIPKVTTVFNKLGEPTFESLDLGCWYTPVGLLENIIEYFHVSLSLPWWASIVTVTIILKLCFFPLMVRSQKIQARLHNCQPLVLKYQTKLTQANLSGNELEALRLRKELSAFMKNKGIEPYKSFITPLCQGPIFLSMFWALRKMANLPVESMKVGGISWFTDLTVSDPLYILPLITSSALFLMMQVILKDASTIMPGSGMMIKLMKVSPLIMFPFIINFPAAVLCYWAVNNICTFIQASTLRQPSVMAYFGIEKRIPHTAEDAKHAQLQLNPFDFKASLARAKKIAQMEQERKRLSEEKYNKDIKKTIIDVKPVEKEKKS